MVEEMIVPVETGCPGSQMLVFLSRYHIDSVRFFFFFFLSFFAQLTSHVCGSEGRSPRNESVFEKKKKREIRREIRGYEFRT